MTTFLATVNIPGYMPMDDDPPTFDNAADAWQHLADERRRDEDSNCYSAGAYSSTWSMLEQIAHDVKNGNLNSAVGSDGTGLLCGDTPVYDGNYDLGLAYSVTAVEEES